MRRAVNDAIKIKQQPNRCRICNANFQDSNIAEAHYASKRHKDNVKEYRKTTLETLKNNSAEMSKNIQGFPRPAQEAILHCNICDVRFEATAANDHYRGDGHKKKKEAYCNVCSILTMSKEQLWQHMHGSKHKKKMEEQGLPAIDVQYSPFDESLPPNLKKLMQEGVCQVCNVKFPTVEHALGHYKSPKHKKSVQDWFEKEKKRNEKLRFSDRTNKNVLENAGNVQPKTELSPAKIIDYNCFACKMNVSKESAVDHHHRASFPHTGLAKLKSDMVSQGIIEEYWLRLGNTIFCTLCGVQICTLFEAKEHFDSSTHQANFQNWHKRLDATKVTSEEDTKWFYCRICAKPLDCTSDAEKHYLAPPHLKKSRLYCKICDVRNDTSELLEIHYTTTSHKENLKKSNNSIGEGATQNSPTPSDNHINNAGNENQKTEDNNGQKTDVLHSKRNSKNKSMLTSPLKVCKMIPNENKTALREQVFQELEKLVQTLYYSKTVPYDVALEYLKNINKEIEDMKNKYEKKEQGMSENGAQYFGNTDFTEEDIKQTSYVSESLKGKHVLAVDELYSFNSDGGPKMDLIDFSDDVPAAERQVVENISKDFNLIDFSYSLDNCNDKKLQVSNKKKKNNDDKSEERINIQQECNQKVDYVIQEEYRPSLDEQDNLDIMLKKIIRLKEHVEEKYLDESNIEKNVLAEIERLIKLVKCSNIPPNVILMCLEKFNEKIDHDLSKDVEKVHEVETEVDGECRGVQAKQDIKYRYSEEDLLSLRTNETFTGRLSMELRKTLNDTRIWNKHCNDLDLD